MNGPSELHHVLTLIAKEHTLLSDAVSDLTRLLDAEAVNLPKILSILQDISVTAKQHFATEEDAMASLNYPWLAPHRLNHQWFQTFISDYQRSLLKGSIRINDDARRNLPNLIRFYVGRRDDEFEEWLATTHDWRQDPIWHRHAEATVCHV